MTLRPPHSPEPEAYWESVYQPYFDLGQTKEEADLLIDHDRDEELHAFVPGDDGDSFAWACRVCGDTAEGLMHNNTWRNVEPLMGEQ